MLNNRLLCRTARNSSRGGFTLVELLVVIGIIAILAGVALGPIMNGIKQAKHNTAMQSARQIGTLFFAYATDNNGTYPFGANSETIAKSLITSNYTADPNLFVITDQIGRNAVTGPGTVVGTTVTLTAANISWNFVATSTTAGATVANTSDLLPLIYFAGNTTAVTYTAVGAKNLVLTAADPFGTDGVAVFYKGNNALYMKAGTVTAGTVTNFVSPNYADTASYTEIVP